MLAKLLQHYAVCKLRAKIKKRDNLTNCPAIIFGMWMACMLLSQQYLSAIDDIDARGQIPAILVHRPAQ